MAMILPGIGIIIPEYRISVSKNWKNLSAYLNFFRTSIVFGIVARIRKNKKKFTARRLSDTMD